jgi:uncharacterized protein
MLHWYLYPLLIATGILVGFINTLAGSGSLISLPLLMYLGLPANVANGTNRVAIMLQSMVGAASFRGQKVITYKEGIWLSVPAVIGSIIGAILAVDLNEVIMKRAIGALMIVMICLILFKPEVWLKGHAGQLRAKPTLWQVVIFFGIGLYGGFIQAGVGFFLLTGLVMGAGMNLVKANALKNLIVALYTPFALVVFIINNQVNWIIGLTLAAGNMLGAFVAARVAVDRGTRFIRIVLLVVLFAASMDLLGVYKWIFS